MKPPLPRRVAVKVLRRALSLAVKEQAGAFGVHHILTNPCWKKYNAKARPQLLADFHRLFELLPVIVPRREWPRLSRLIDRTAIFLK